ncbi:hypothetical protein H6G21_09880 [Alkalinema sp. FACHB-956]|nr:hypothetical protein [Alkalinema sp. FACHB-956]MBD2327182.1 hypothetical protein [Alkalinema sp. FACHB-956]
MGRALVLLDGLDEVQEKEYTFERFTEVEIADFDHDQITTFVENWFRAKEDLPKATRFIQRLEESEPIWELASSPLLLTLLCLVFGE